MMQSLGCLALAFWQEDAGSVQHDVHLMMIFMGIIMVAVVLGFLGIAVGGLMGLKLFGKLEGMAERAEGKMGPVLEKTHALVEELGPKVRTITTNVEQISYTARTKMDEFSATADQINRTVKEANARTHEKVVRVDGMVNEALNTAHHVSRTVQDSVRKPVQQLAGIVAAVKRGVETWVDRSPFKRHVYAEDVYESSPYDVPATAPRATAGTSGHYTPVEPSPSPNAASETKRVTPLG